MNKFTAVLEIIGINPYVLVPEAVLDYIFQQAGKDKGHIPICGDINDKPYRQTLVKYSGQWRLYVNTTMLKNSPKRIGEKLDISIQFDPESRVIELPEILRERLEANKQAYEIYEGLSASMKKEICRYLTNLKTKEALERNVDRAIDFLLGRGTFVGRSLSASEFRLPEIPKN